MPGTTRGSGKHRLHALVGTARGHVALPALPGRRLGRGRWRTASPPAEPRALVLGAPPTALLLLRVFCTLANCTSGGGRSAARWARSWAQTPAFPHASLDFGSAARACKGCSPRSSSPRSSSSGRPWAWAAGRGAGAGDGTSCGDASSLPRWGRGQAARLRALGCPVSGHTAASRGASPHLVGQSRPLGPTSSCALTTTKRVLPRLPPCEAAVLPGSTCPSCGPVALARAHERNPCESSTLALSVLWCLGTAAPALLSSETHFGVQLNSISGWGTQVRERGWGARDPTPFACNTAAARSCHWLRS